MIAYDITNLVEILNEEFDNMLQDLNAALQNETLIIEP